MSDRARPACQNSERSLFRNAEDEVRVIRDRLGIDWTRALRHAGRERLTGSTAGPFGREV